MKILVIEDDVKIAQLIKKGLTQGGFAVDTATTGPEGLSQAESQDYDALIIDLMLPGQDGLSVIEELRRGGNRAPILILSAKRSVDDRVKGLKTGGDDYLTKPFSFVELLARVQALIRRATPSAEPTQLKFEDLVMNLLSREVTRGAKPLESKCLNSTLYVDPQIICLIQIAFVIRREIHLDRVWSQD